MDATDFKAINVLKSFHSPYLLLISRIILNDLVILIIYFLFWKANWPDDFTFIWKIVAIIHFFMT